jgi:hypothetical protein
MFIRVIILGEQIQFENRFTITKERYMDWVKHPIKKSMRYYERIAWIGLLVLMLFLVIAQLSAGSMVILYITGALALLCIYRAFFRPAIIANKQFSQFTAMQGSAEWERVTTFTDEMTVSDGCSVTAFDYDKITEIVDYKGYIALGIGPGMNKSYLRLKKDGFVQSEDGTDCSDKGFMEFIKRQCRDIAVRA